MQKYFYDSVCVNSCALFPIPCSLFPTSARSLVYKSSIIHDRSIARNIDDQPGGGLCGASSH
ncbi:MAG: hypothetical protein F6K56_08790 [Moorea sp. SIO3G5]|nr:hypothetical protein [Moorena sp. SIO3G5]